MVARPKVEEKLLHTVVKVFHSFLAAAAAAALKVVDQIMLIFQLFHHRSSPRTESSVNFGNLLAIPLLYPARRYLRALIKQIGHQPPVNLIPFLLYAFRNKIKTLMVSLIRILFQFCCYAFRHGEHVLRFYTCQPCTKCLRNTLIVLTASDACYSCEKKCFNHCYLNVLYYTISRSRSGLMAQF